MHYHGHRERLRTRLKESPGSLADYEVLEMLLGYVLRRQDTKPLAKELLAQFHSLRGVLDARPVELRSINGFGPTLEAYWSLLREFMARYTEAPLRQREILCDPKAVANMARARLAGKPYEEVWVAYLDNQNRLLSWEHASKGTVDSVTLYQRDVLERALEVKASGIIVVHNHPGGDPKPSGADVELTKRLANACQTIGLRFLDHVIVTDEACYSLMQESLLL